MKRKQGFIRKTAIKAGLGLAGLATLLFGGCSDNKDSPQLIQDDQGNYVSTSTRQELTESLFEHYGTLTKEDKAQLLQDSTLLETGSNAVTVAQTLDFGTLTPMFAKDNLGNLGVFLYAGHDDVLYTMNWAFQDGFTSSIDSNGNMVELLQQNLNIGGKHYRVTKARTQADEVQLELMTGKVTATLNVGDSMTMGVDGVDYDITLIGTTDNGNGTYRAKWQVNGEITQDLRIGDLDILVNGQFIGTADAGNGNATFSIGAHKISITDESVSDDAFSGSVKGNGVLGEFWQDSDARARIKATVNGSEITINSLAYQLLANSVTDTDIFVPATERLSDHLDNPGANLVEVGFDGLRTKKDDGSGNLVNRVYSSMDFTYASTATDSSYTLTFTNKENITYNNVNFIENVGTSATDRVLEQKLVMTEGTSSDDKTIIAGTQFVLSGTNDFTHILRYDSIDTGNRRLNFTDLGTGTRSATYDENTGEANLIVGGVTYKAFVDVNTGNIAVDLNGDGTIDGSSVAIVDRYGAKITVPSATQYVVTTHLSTSADKIDGSSVDEVVDLEFCMAGSGMDVTLPMVPRVFQDIGEWKGQSRYGVKTTVKDFRDVSLNYPEIQEEPVATLSER
ncbi:hypothetical protein KY310_00795 [Candidatus Woesearchaeota archaeon]|nr:hypothetical protein [Candidatus Woesearchaeota archaeon]